jgi:hypothetical protein
MCENGSSMASDERNDDDQKPGKALAGIAAGLMSDAAKWLASLPPLVQKSIVKSVGVVAGDLWSVPAAKLRSTATRIDAEGEARATFIKAVSDAAIQRLPAHPELIERALHNFAASAVSQQSNKEAITRIAIENLKDNPPTADSAEEIDPDWLNTFTNIAGTISNVEMQQLFGRILSGEIKEPGSFSPLTIQTLPALTRHDAELFRRMCQMSYLFAGRAAVIAEPFGNAASNALIKFGLGLDQLNVLNEAGLIISDYNSYGSLSLPHVPSAANSSFDFAGLTVVIEKERDDAETNMLSGVHGVTFTRVGRELRRVVPRPLTVPTEYMQGIREWLRTNGFDLKLVPERH